MAKRSVQEVGLRKDVVVSQLRHYRSKEGHGSILTNP